jgi:putative nucleotidyltransferase with HDIG domain
VKLKLFRKKQKGIAERKTEIHRKGEVPYKALGMGLLLWLFVTWLFFGQGIARHIDIAEGERFPSPIVASVDFESENKTETDFNRDKAAMAVPFVFTIDPGPEKHTTEVVEKIFGRLMKLPTATSNEYVSIENSIGDLLLGTSVGTKELIDQFPGTEASVAKGTLTTNIVNVMSAGILSDEYRRTLFRDAPDRKLTITAGSGGETSATVSQQDIYSTRKACTVICGGLKDSKQRELAERLLATFVVNNMAYDESTTEALRNEARQQVEPVMQQHVSGSPIVRAGDLATKQNLLMLTDHEQKRREEQEGFDQFTEIVGNGILLLAGLIATSVFLRIVAPKMIQQPGQLLLLVILSLFTLSLAQLFTYLSVQYELFPPSLLTYLVPHALSILLAAILLGGSAAICLGLWTSFATAVLLDQSFNVFALGILITITATSTARNVHRRSSLFQAGLWVCAVKVLFALIAAILKQPKLSILFSQISAAILSGMLSTVFALLLIPVFEKLFKITTDITLLELSDMGHPLLQKMAMQAPGTYHHSLMVATLAQNAAEVIGANSLLVRVCAYYHDIGKMAKPEFFTENIQHRENPHDELSPHMSALVIVSHVKEGLTLAKRHKLPQPVLDAIEQHHGNGLISYFYHKAKVQQQKELDPAHSTNPINDSDFRYGGAPAVSPEMAILSLADASEAAARSIEKPTPKKIANMMDDIFSTKIRDGQMDQASLTMAEINAVKQSFVFSLSNMLHGRIPYPKDHENNVDQPAEPPSDPAEEAPIAG